jgi:Sulfotransferase domain
MPTRTGGGNPVLKLPPDFVIIGAPKCGTTSLHATLQGHPEMFLSSIKEPHYFAFDYPNRREVDSLRDYDGLFSKAKDNQLRGESSACYLSSVAAVPAILERRPDAKFIALVRNPVDLFVSWHNELLKYFDEDRSSPESAWRMQEKRARGIDIPKGCIVPAMLQYKSMCSLGQQLERVFRLVPETQRLVLLYDDLRRDPKSTIEKITTFLGVSSNGTGVVFESNKFGQYNNSFTPWLLRAGTVNPTIKRLRAKLKPFLDSHGIRPMSWLTRKSLESVPKPVLSDSFRQELNEVFSDDIRLLEQLLRVDLSHWRRLETSTRL